MRHSLSLLQSILVPMLVAVPSLPAVAATHPFAVEDLIAFDRISDPAVAPDGKRVVFTVSSLAPDATARRTDLWIADVQAGGARRLTSHEAADTSAAFTVDGKWIYFLSSRGGSSQVWRIAPDGGEAEAVTSLPVDVGGFRLSPDGKRLVVSLEVFPACADLECTRKKLAEPKKSSGQLYDHLFVRHWDAWSDGRRSHLFAMPVTGGGSAVDLMKGMDADCPSKPFGSEGEYTFTPDAKHVLFSARDVGREEAWSTRFDLFLTPLDGAAPPRDLTPANRAWLTEPVFSPDGKTLLYLGTTRPGYESDRRHLMLADWQGSALVKPRELAADWDHSPEEMVYSRDGKTIYANAEHVGNQSLFAIDAQTGKTRLLVEKGHVTAPRLAGGGLVFGLDHLRSPAELYRAATDGSGVTAITSLNQARLAAVRMGEPEQFTFAGWNGETVHAWLVKPVDLAPGKKYPIAFLVHGGPQGSFANDFHYRWNPQIYAGAGYAAVLVDFHGSTGYGQAFTDAIGDDWGGKPLVDLQKGLEAAIQKYPFLAGDRACALGASYGGYMMNWIAGNWPDRFACIVTHDGNIDERMAYYDTEELWFPEWEHRGTPWDNPASYARHNPIDFVKNWKTPTLVVHGGRDYRVVDTQGLSTFTALQRRGVPSRLLYFPDENHWVLKPQNSLLWHHTVLDWLHRYTGK